MADKFLSKLTIDNVAQVIDNVEEFKHIVKNVSITSTKTWVEGATTTITKAGIYLCYLNFPFAPSGVTGTKYGALGIKLGDVNVQLEFYGGVAANSNNTRSATVFVSLKESSLPITMSVIGMSDKTSGTGTSELTIVKLTSLGII